MATDRQSRVTPEGKGLCWPKIQGTSQEGGWYYASCRCGWAAQWVNHQLRADNERLRAALREQRERIGDFISLLEGK